MQRTLMSQLSVTSFSNFYWVTRMRIHDVRVEKGLLNSQICSNEGSESVKDDHGFDIEL